MLAWRLVMASVADQSPSRGEEASLWSTIVEVPSFLSRHRSALLCLFAVAGVYWILARRLLFAPIGFDEGYFLWTGWSLNHGMVPYRNCVEYKPVNIFIINALSIKLLGLHYLRYRYAFVAITLAP